MVGRLVHMGVGVGEDVATEGVTVRSKAIGQHHHHHDDHHRHRRAGAAGPPVPEGGGCMETVINVRVPRTTMVSGNTNWLIDH